MDSNENNLIPPVPNPTDLEGAELELSTSDDEVHTLEAEQQVLENVLQDEVEDDSWKDRTGLSEETLLGAIETVVFMSDRPISLLKIRSLIDPKIPLKVLYDGLNQIKKTYEVTTHGIRLVEVAQGFQLRTKATYSKYVQELYKVTSLVLTPTALEVLAIIAYKQPISKSEVEKIRGVDSSHIIRGLMDKHLVRVDGRSEELGRPVIYRTTNEFLEVFNLKDLTELPPEHELRLLAESNQVGKISDIRGLVTAPGDALFNQDELAELDDISRTLQQIHPDTRFTQSLKNEEKKRITGASTEEAGPVRSAFEVLEYHLTLQEIIEENKKSAQSRLLGDEGDALNPVVMRIGPLVLPENENHVETSEEIPEEDNLLYADHGEKATLNLAIDEAFQKLLSDGDTANVNEDMGPDLEELEIKENAVIDLVSQMAERARGLDFDLDFLDGEDAGKPAGNTSAPPSQNEE